VIIARKKSRAGDAALTSMFARQIDHVVCEVEGDFVEREVGELNVLRIYDRSASVGRVGLVMICLFCMSDPHGGDERRDGMSPRLSAAVMAFWGDRE